MDLLSLVGIVAEYDKYLKESYGDPVDFPHVAEWAQIKARIFQLVVENDTDEE